MVNTEKPMSEDEKKRHGLTHNPPIKRNQENPIVNTPKTEEKNKLIEKGEVKEEKKPEVKKKEPIKIKKDSAKIDSKNLPISTKKAVAICKFISKKRIEKAIEDLEQVLYLKKVVPMKGRMSVHTPNLSLK